MRQRHLVANPAASARARRTAQARIAQRDEYAENQNTPALPSSKSPNSRRSTCYAFAMTARSRRRSPSCETTRGIAVDTMVASIATIAIEAITAAITSGRED